MLAKVDPPSYRELGHPNHTATFSAPLISRSHAYFKYRNSISGIKDRFLVTNDNVINGYVVPLYVGLIRMKQRS